MTLGEVIITLGEVISLVRNLVTLSGKLIIHYLEKLLFKGNFREISHYVGKLITFRELSHDFGE